MLEGGSKIGFSDSAIGVSSFFEPLRQLGRGVGVLEMGDLFQLLQSFTDHPARLFLAVVHGSHVDWQSARVDRLIELPSRPVAFDIVIMFAIAMDDASSLHIAPAVVDEGRPV